MGNLQKVYQELTTMVSTQLKWKGRRETFHTLIHFMLGILLSHDVRLGRVASRSGFITKIESVEQRYRRWLSNPNIKAKDIVDPIAKHLLFQRRKKRIRLQIDRTIVKGKFNVLMITISHRGRALPLVWKILPHSGSCSQKDCQCLFNRVDKMLSRYTQVIVLGDREFGTVDLIRFCRGKGWDYVLRVKRTYTAANPHEGFPLYWFPLASLLPFRQMHRWLHDWLYVQDEFMRTHIALTCAPDSNDPWILVTSLPSSQQAIREYKRRFGCEELFSDLKARGFDIEKTQLRHPQRFDRLLIVVTLLTFWLAGVARRLFVTRQIDNLIQPSHRHRYSFFQIAYRWLEQQIICGRSSIPDPKYVFGLLV